MLLKSKIQFKKWIQRVANTECPFTLPQDLAPNYLTQFKSLKPEYVNTIMISPNENCKVIDVNTIFKQVKHLQRSLTIGISNTEYLSMLSEQEHFDDRSDKITLVSNFVLNY